MSIASAAAGGGGALLLLAGFLNMLRLPRTDVDALAVTPPTPPAAPPTPTQSFPFSTPEECGADEAEEAALAPGRRIIVVCVGWVDTTV